MPPNAPTDPRSERTSEASSASRQRSSSTPTRRFYWLLLGGVLLLVTVVAFAGSRSYRELAAARQRASELALQIERAQWRIRDLRDELERLQDDPELLERIAREDLGLVAPGERIVVLPEE